MDRALGTATFHESLGLTRGLCQDILASDIKLQQQCYFTLTYPHIMFGQGFCISSSYLLLFLASLTFTQADYIIDDSNSTVAYTPIDMWIPTSASSPAEITFSGNSSDETIDYSRIYNSTL